MSERDALALDRSLGDRLELAAYRSDFRYRDDRASGRDSWKFERRQHFQEPGSPSWEAFRRGDWQEALRLTGDRRDQWRKVAREHRERGSVFHRVRVVEEPLTPYLQWELQALRVQGESGMPIRVVSGERLRGLEGPGELPEVVTLGGQVLYEVVYTDEGVLDGGVRFADPGTVGRWERFVKALYRDGEDIVSYVDRQVAHMPAPLATRE
jgi:hypothetical protein